MALIVTRTLLSDSYFQRLCGTSRREIFNLRVEGRAAGRH